MERLRASWLIPMEGPPVEGGALAVEGGRILAAGPWQDVRAFRGRVLDLPGCALMPALVNAHTHLELTGLGPVPQTSGFSEWILDVARRKREAPAGFWPRAVGRGASECLRTGQAWVADVVSRPEALAHPGAPGCLVFPEVLAPWPERVPAAAAWVREAVETVGDRIGGISPHSAYTTCPEGFRLAAEGARTRGLRVMIHLAESPDEIRFCLEGAGPVAEVLYAGLGLPPPPAPGLHPVEWLDRLGVLGPTTVVVHAVHLGRAHVERLRKKGVAVVLCPRSNRRLSGRPAPGRAFLDAGLKVGLGTDSVLSSGSLDLWEDMRAAVEDYGWKPAEALWAATRGGAEALGIAPRVGRFGPGARADILVAELGPGRDPWERVLGGGRPVGVWFGGRPVERTAWVS